MTRTHIVLLLALPVLGLIVALGLAGWQAGPLALTDDQDKQVVPDPRPQAVSVVRGFIVHDPQNPIPNFDVRNCPTVAEIYDLLPGRGAILALEYPLFTSAAEAGWLADQAPVLGLSLGGESHCYPLAILNWHSLVMDRLARQTVYVLWDPPSGLSLARRQWSNSRPLGVAGLGYRGVGLAYEKTTGALWDLFDGHPISFPGKPAGFVPQLKSDHNWLPLRYLTWRAWRTAHPDTTVLAHSTGYSFDYNRDPYAAAALGPGGRAEDYWSSDLILAPDSLRDASGTLPDKSWVLGFNVGGQTFACPLAPWQARGQQLVKRAFGTQMVQLHVKPQDNACWVTDAQGLELPQVRLFWFAWKARCPNTQVWLPATGPEETVAPAAPTTGESSTQ
jgi:hypothetical protein